MSEEQAVSYQNLGGKGDFVEDAPKLTDEVKKRSDAKLEQMFASIAKKQGATVEKTEKSQPSETQDGRGQEGAQTSPEAGKPEEKPSESPTTEESDTQKPDEKTEAKESEEADDQKTQRREIDWEKESKKHQSRADRLDSDLKSRSTELEGLRKQVDDLKSYESAVEEFKTNPVQFLVQNFPDITEQLRSYADPVGSIEAQVGKYRKDLEKRYREQHGEEWEYDPNEALTPGTASFRFKLALEDKMTEARTQYQQTVDGMRRRQEQQKEQREKDREKIQQEFDLTDEELKAVDDYMNKTPLTYYNVAKAALVDKIVEQRINALTPTPKPEKDLTEAPAGNKGKRTDDKEPSSDMKRLAARMGVGSLFKEQ